MSIHHAPPRTQPHFATVDEILNSCCPVCSMELTITYRHVGGHYSKVPHVTCSNMAGGETHLLSRVNYELAGDYWAVVKLMEDEFTGHEEMEMEASDGD